MNDGIEKVTDNRVYPQFCEHGTYLGHQAAYARRMAFEFECKKCIDGYTTYKLKQIGNKIVTYEAHGFGKLVVVIYKVIENSKNTSLESIFSSEYFTDYAIGLSMYSEIILTLEKGLQWPTE